MSADKKLDAEEIVRQLAAKKYEDNADAYWDIQFIAREWVADNPLGEEQVSGQHQRRTQPCRNPEPCPPNVNFRHLFCKNCGVLLSSHAKEKRA